MKMTNTSITPETLSTTEPSPETQFLLNFTRKKEDRTDHQYISQEKEKFKINSTSFRDVLLQDILVDEEYETLQDVENEFTMDNNENNDNGTEVMDYYTVPLPPHVKEKIYAPWKTSIIVKGVGKSFGYKALLTWRTSIWRPKGNLHMIDLGYDFYLVKFTQSIDFMSELERGPWFVGEHYLFVRKWEPEFQAANANVSSLAAWVRLPELPIEFFHSEILRSIGNKIGCFIKIDTISNVVVRGPFARLCVQLDLDKPLLNQVTIGSFLQRIQYENLPTVCYSCGRIGHTQEQCKSLEMGQDNTASGNT